MNNAISIVLILASIGIGLFYIKPVYQGDTGGAEIEKKSVKELKIERTRYEAALTKMKEIIEIRNGKLTKYNSIKENERQKIAKMIPNNIDSIRLIIDVDNIARAYGMSLRDISISDDVVKEEKREGTSIVADPKPYSYINLDFSLNGSYDNLIAFVGDLEKSLRVVDFDKIRIEEDKSSNQESGKTKKTVTGELLYKMTASIKTYFINAK